MPGQSEALKKPCATCIYLIGEYEKLIERFKRGLIATKAVETEEMAEAAVSRERAVILNARRGK